jgi:phosphatidylglycerophosphatase A
MEYSFVRSSVVEAHALEALNNRGVMIEDIAKLTLFLQKPYVPDLTIETCIESIEHVLKKREVQNALLTGIELDMLAEKEGLSFPAANAQN